MLGRSTDDQETGHPGPRGLVRAAVAAAVGLAVLLAIALSAGLLTDHPAGAADNGDGARLYCGAGLRPDTPDGRSNWKGGVVLRFDRVAPCADPIPSSAGPILRAAATGATGTWSLSRLGRLYALLAGALGGAAAWAATRAGPLRALVLSPALLPLADPTFSRFFVSTYSEPAGLLGSVAVAAGLAVTCVTRREHRPERMVALLLMAGGGVLAATAKVAYVPVLGVAVVACALTAVSVRRDRRRWYDRAAPAVLALVAVAVVVGPISAAGAWQARHYPAVNAYDLIFTTVLPAVPDATSALGLPAAAAEHAGSAYYPGPASGVPGAAVIAAAPNSAQRAALRVLADHPGAALRAVGIAVQATRGSDLSYLPSAAWTAATPPAPLGQVVGEQGATAPTLRAWLAGMRLPWLPSVLALLGVVAGVAGVCRRRGPWSWFARIAGPAAVGAVLLAVVAVAGDGYFEIAKHVWLSAYLLDVTVLALLGTLAAALAGRLRRRSAPVPDVETPTVVLAGIGAGQRDSGMPDEPSS